MRRRSQLAAMPEKASWLLIGGGVIALLLVGGVAVEAIVNYTDRKSFAKMMDGILAQLGVDDPDARLAIIAHAGVETKMGTAGSANPKRTFNFWNITAGSAWQGPTYAGGDTEYGKIITQAWRVYDSPEAAAQDYLNFLSATDHKWIRQPDGSTVRASVSYKDALDKLFAGDVSGFVYTLRDAGYYTAPAADYYAMIQGQSNLARGYVGA